LKNTRTFGRARRKIGGGWSGNIVKGAIGNCLCLQQARKPLRRLNKSPAAIEL